MIKTYEDLLFEYKHYVNAKAKIAREIKAGKFFLVTKGLYETSMDTPGHYLAGSIYGPSYLSFDYALAYYNLIPEAVYHTYTSATYHKRRRKKYKNRFGTFLFRDIPNSVYPMDIIVHQEAGYSYQIATAEKALCDKLYSLSPVHSLKELKQLLFEDLRIDERGFDKLNFESICQLAPLYRSSNLNLLLRLIKGEIYNATHNQTNVK